MCFGERIAIWRCPFYSYIYIVFVLFKKVKCSLRKVLGDSRGFRVSAVLFLLQEGMSSIERGSFSLIHTVLGRRCTAK